MIEVGVHPLGGKPIEVPVASEDSLILVGAGLLGVETFIPASSSGFKLLRFNPTPASPLGFSLVPNLPNINGHLRFYHENSPVSELLEH